MRYNRWLLKDALRDVERLCTNHPDSAAAIRVLADWIIEQLAEDAHLKGQTLPFPDGKKTYKRWAVGPIVVIFSVMPLPDCTVVIEGFTPNG
jgi:hypothetical protein